MRYNGTNPHLAPGALLAVPPPLAPAVAVTTTIGKKLLEALTAYGGYIVDDTASDSAAICMEAAVNDEMARVYNISMAYPGGLGRGPLYDDLVAIFQSLHVVTNNAPGAVGGGGTPNRPPAPPICGAGADRGRGQHER